MAAERLHIAQPPLSQQIRFLEEELGVKLFVTTKRQVQLTEAGKVFLEQSYLILTQVEQAIQAAQRVGRGEIGRLVVGFVGSATYGVLPKIVLTFRERFPDVELILHEMTSDQQIQALHNRRIDLGFVRSLTDDSTLTGECIFIEPLVLALPEAHPLATRAEVSLQALADEPFILFPPHLGLGFYNQIISLCQQAGFSPKVAQEAIQMQTGVSLVPASLQNLHRTGVIYKPLSGLTPKVEMHLVWRQHNTSPVLQAFLNIARENAQA